MKSQQKEFKIIKFDPIVTMAIIFLSLKAFLVHANESGIFQQTPMEWKLVMYMNFLLEIFDVKLPRMSQPIFFSKLKITCL